MIDASLKRGDRVIACSLIDLVDCIGFCKFVEAAKNSVLGTIE